MDPKDESQNSNNQVNNNSNPNVKVKDGKSLIEKTENTDPVAINLEEEVNVTDIKPRSINTKGGSNGIGDNDTSDKQQADTSTVSTLPEMDIKKEKQNNFSGGMMGGEDVKVDKEKETIETTSSGGGDSPTPSGMPNVDLPKSENNINIEDPKGEKNTKVDNEKQEPQDLVSLTKEINGEQEEPKKETPSEKEQTMDDNTESKDTVDSSGGMGGGGGEKPTDDGNGGMSGPKETFAGKILGSSDGDSHKIVESILQQQEEKLKQKEKGEEGTEPVLAKENNKPKEKLKKGGAQNPDVANNVTDNQNTIQNGNNSTDISQNKQKDKDITSNGAPKVEEQKTASEQPAEKTPQQASFDEGKKQGLMIGRSVGYGMKIEEIVEGEGDNQKITYKKTKFEDVVSPNADPQNADPSKVVDAKTKFIEQSHAAAKKQDEATPNYWAGYLNGYNTGYSQGERYKKEEEEKNAQDAAEAEKTEPDYRLGLEVGKLAAMLSVKNNGKGDTPFELTTQGEKGVQYKTTLANVKINSDKGLDPKGNAVAKPELYKKAFTAGYNMAYQEAITAKNKPQTHQDKLADPNFRKGYEEGNKLGRNENLSPEEKARLEGVKKNHFSDGAREKAEKDEAYAKERGAFIYGYNSAYYQLQAEAQAKAKALQEKKEKDPVYQLGKTAGTIKGILASVFGDRGFRPILQNKQEDVLKENGIPFTIPDMIATIILGEKIPENNEFLAKPASEADSAKKKELEAKRAEQNAFFRESYTRSFVEGYQKGQKDKGTFEQNKQRNDPDYQRAMQIVYKGEEGAKESGGVVKLELNAGGLVAYASFKLKFLEDSDPKKTSLEDAIASEKAKADKETEGYKLGFNQSYSFFASKLANPQDKIYLAITGKEALQDYKGHNAEEEVYYYTGADLAREKLKRQEALKERRLQGEDTQAEESILEKIFYASRVDVKCKIANGLGVGKDENAPKPEIKEPETMEALDTELEDKLNAASLAEVKNAFRYFNNGYNAVILNSLKENKAATDKGNDKKELTENIDKNVDKFQKIEKDIEVGKVKITNAAIEAALKNNKDKAKEIYKQAADEAYGIAYKAYTELKGKGSNRKPVGKPSEIKNLYKKEDFEKRVTSKRLEFINENNNLKDGDEKKVNGKTFEETANGFLYFFIKGFNYTDTIDERATYGLAKGWTDGESFVVGYNGDAESKASSKDAYTEGKAVAAKEKEYGSFQEGMMLLNEKEHLEKAEAKKEEDSFVNGEGNVADENSYKQAKLDAKKVWHKVVLHMEKQEIPENYGNEVQIKILEKGSNKPINLDIDADNAEEHWNKRLEYVELAANYYGQDKLKNAFYSGVEQRMKEAYLKDESSKNKSDLEKEQEILAEYQKTIEPFLTSYKKGYLETINAIKASTSSNVNSKLFYACGFKDGFMRTSGLLTLPMELQAVEAKKEEIDEKNKHEVAIDKTHKEYLNGEAKGAEIGFKVKLQTISQNQIETEISTHNKQQAEREKSLKKEDKGSDAFSGMDEEDDITKIITYQQIDQNDYQKGKNNGQIAGIEAAKVEKHAEQKPVPIDFKLSEQKDIDTEKTSNVKTEENKTTDTENKTDGKVEDKQKPPVLSELFVQGFNESYWKARDAKAGEIEGIKAVANKKDAYDIAAYYVVIQNDTDKVEEGKRAIKNKDIFENSFINAREAARVNPNVAELLKKTTEIKERKNNKEKTEAEKKQETIKKETEKAHNVVPEAAKKVAQQYGYVKAILEMNLGDKLKEMYEASDIIKLKGFTEEQLDERKRKKEEIRLRKIAKEKLEKDKETSLSSSGGMGGSENKEATLSNGEREKSEDPQQKEKWKKDKEEKKKEIAEDEAAAEKLKAAQTLMEKYKTIAPMLTDENGVMVPCTQEWLDKTMKDFVKTPNEVFIDEKISNGLGQVAKHFTGSDDEQLVRIEDWNADLESGTKAEHSDNDKKGKEGTDLAQKQKEKENRFSYHYLVPQEEKAKIRAKFVSQFSEGHPTFYSKAVMDFTNMYVFDKTGITQPSTNSNTTSNTTSNQEQEDKNTLSNIINTLINADASIQLNDLPILKVLQEQENTLEDAHGQIGEEHKKTKKDQEAFKELDLERFFIKNENKVESVLDLEKKIASLNVETDADKIEKMQQDLNALIGLENKIKNLEVSMNQSKEKIDKESDDVRLFLKNKLKLSLPKTANKEILDYINYLNKKLILQGPFSYYSKMFKMSQQGKLMVYENAEDVRIDAKITIDKSDYNFKAAGFEYIENKNSIAIFSGKAIVPRLEGSGVEGERQEYNFKELGFDLNQNLRTQLKLQQNKLEAGPIHKSTGTREKTSGQDISK